MATVDVCAGALSTSQEDNVFPLRGKKGLFEVLSFLFIIFNQTVLNPPYLSDLLEMI